jgi:hypothetical protein
MPISLLVVARRLPENATFSSEPCRGGPVFGSDSEKTLFEAELKFCIFTPKKYSAHSRIRHPLVVAINPYVIITPESDHSAVAAMAPSKQVRHR